MEKNQEKRALKVKASVSLEDGLYQGKIVRIEYRNEPYEYTDVVIQEPDSGMELKAGFPTFVCPTSKLGELLKKFGADLDKMVGSDIVPDRFLVGKACEFLVTSDKGKDGKEYANIVRESVKPKTAK